MLEIPPQQLARAREGLPDTAGQARPYVPEAELELHLAWRALSERRVLSGHTDAVYVASFSPNGERIVTASDDLTVRLWDANTGKQIGAAFSDAAGPGQAAFTPDGRRMSR